jgi:predicted DNA-binding transcriptional regulator AlpA
LGIKRSTFYHRMREGAFLTHMNMRNRRVVWKSDLLAARETAARRRAEPKAPPRKKPKPPSETP